MKLIMEGWRSWGITQKLAGDKYKHNPRDPKELEDDNLPFALYINPEAGWHELILYKQTVKHTDADPVQYNNPIVIAMIVVDKTDEPCIPDTFQVRYSALDNKFQGKGYGTLLYGLAFYYVNNKQGSGLTSDHASSTSDKAKKMWDKYADTKGMIKKKTKSGNDEFDYEWNNDDPDDDCDFGAAQRTMTTDFFGDKYRKGLGTHHSWIMRGNKFKGTFEQLVEQDKTYLNLVDDENEFRTKLTSLAQDLFQKEYGGE